MRGKQYSLIVVGTGFASSFFLFEYLRRASPRVRVLVLERGPMVSHAELSQDRERLQKAGAQSVVNTTRTSSCVLVWNTPSSVDTCTSKCPWIVEVLLKGLDNFQGSTSLTGHGYMLYNGPHRKQRAAALIETSNQPVLRDERGKWRQILHFKAIFEDLPDARNCVGISPADPDRPVLSFRARSDYALAGIASLEGELPRILAPLPVESFTVAPQPNPAEAHILGTTVMGSNPKDSIVDADLVHHQVRNLLVLGSGVFPAASPANPTLTLSALSLRSAARLVARSPMS